MKLFLFTSVVCFAAALAAPADKEKRDILPGDSRYGTEHDHHHEHENEVQILKAAGGYVGSYTVPDDTEDHLFQVQPQQTYGPPGHTPGKLLGTDFFATSDDKTSSLLVPSTSYGIPDTTQVFANFLGSIDDKNTAVIKTTVQEHPKFDTVQKTEVQQPAVVHKHVETVPQTVSLPQVKVTASHLPSQTQGVSALTSSFNTFPSYTSYSSYNSIPLKTVDHHLQVQVPQPYQVPVTKHVAVPVPVPHTVEVPKPYYVRVPQPVQVTVDRPYPVEVPRPVPYPVHHYVKTNVPVAHPVVHQIAHPIAHHVTVDTKANPVQTFFENPQLTFQNVLSTFSNPLDGIQTSLENFEFPTLPFIPSSFPVSSIPFLPQEPQPAAPVQHVNLPSSTSDSITIDNPALKNEIKPIVKPIVKPPSKQAYKPSTACAGCIVSSATSNKQEYVQPIDANGGYVY